MSHSKSDEPQTWRDLLQMYRDEITLLSGSIGGLVSLIHFIINYTSIAWKIGLSIVYLSIILYLYYVLYSKGRYDEIFVTGDHTPGHEYETWSRVLAGAALITLIIGPVGYLGYNIYPKTEQQDNFRLLVAPLDAPDESYGINESVFMKLTNKVNKYDDIQLVPLDSAITIEEGSNVARDVAAKKTASMMIWGWYETYEQSREASAIIRYEVLDKSLNSPVKIKIFDEKEVFYSLDNIESFKTKLTGRVQYVVSLTLGMAYYGLQNYDKSAHFYTDALNHSFNTNNNIASSRAYYLRGLSYYRNDLLHKAIVDFKNVKGGKKLLSRSLFYRGTILSMQDKNKKAVRLLDRSIELDPTNTAALTNNGLVLSHLGKYERANESFNKALAVDSSKTSAWVNQALVFTEQDRFGEAHENYKRALSIDSMEASIWTNRGVMLSEWGKYHRAIESHKRALELDPKNPWILFNMGTAYMEEYQAIGNDINLQKALRNFKRSLKHDSSDADTWSNKATVLALLGREDSALKSYSKAISIDSTLIRKMIHLGQGFINSSRLKESTKYMRHAAKIRPNEIEVWQTLGRSLARRDSFKQSINAYNHALDIDSTDGLTLLLKGNAWNMNGESEKALDLYTRAVEEDSSLADPWFNRAFILRALGEESEAKRSFERACELDTAYCSKPYPQAVREYPF